ncbi:DNA oxidative demethylase AlkB [Aliikangiella sp. IMCC44632]
MSDLFQSARPEIEEIYPQTFVLSKFADSEQLLALIPPIIAQSRFRQMQTPMGHLTNIPVTNCGEWGWISDINGYRYSKTDPLSQRAWPAMPKAFSEIANRAAKRAGFAGFVPDACLINHYQVGSKLGSHQDKNESDFNWPIVSVSLGLQAVFQIYGQERAGVQKSYLLLDGDVMVWGGKSRLIYHGIKTLKADPLNPQLTSRINLTFRKAA